MPAGAVSRADRNVELNPLRSALLCTLCPRLGTCLFAPKICSMKPMPHSPGTKTIEIDQSFEPGERNRRPTNIDLGGSEDVRSIMSDEFDGLDATEKAAIRATLIRCRVLAAKIANELSNRRPEHFDRLSLADLYASLVRAAGVLEQKKR